MEVYHGAVLAFSIGKRGYLTCLGIPALGNQALDAELTRLIAILFLRVGHEIDFSLRTGAMDESKVASSGTRVEVWLYLQLLQGLG